MADFGRYSDGAQRVIVLAQEEARRLNYNYIDTEHLLLGLIRFGRGVAIDALEKSGVDLDATKVEIERIIGQGDAVVGGEMDYAPRAKKVVLELALEAARDPGHKYAYVGTGHILIGLLRESDGVAASVLESMGADLKDVHAAIMDMLEPSDP